MPARQTARGKRALVGCRLVVRPKLLNFGMREVGQLSGRAAACSAAARSSRWACLTAANPAVGCGCGRGLPRAWRLTKRTRTSRTWRFSILQFHRNLVRPERFELPTCWIEARRSIQLSYGRTENRPAPSLPFRYPERCEDSPVNTPHEIEVKIAVQSAAG